MTEAPERIWYEPTTEFAWPHEVEDEESAHAVEYIRRDIVEQHISEKLSAAGWAAHAKCNAKLFRFEAALREVRAWEKRTAMNFADHEELDAIIDRALEGGGSGRASSTSVSRPAEKSASDARVPDPAAAPDLAELSKLLLAMLADAQKGNFVQTDDLLSALHMLPPTWIEWRRYSDAHIAKYHPKKEP